MPEVVLTIGGSDSGGGAGIQADIKTFSALGLHGTSALTAVTAQNTLGVQHIYPLAPEQVRAQLESITDDFPVAYAKTGMLHCAEIVDVVAEHLRSRRIPLVLDPVIEAEAGGRLLQPDAVLALKEHLIPISRVVTPNIFEAEALTGISVREMAGAELAARQIISMGAQAAIIKGGHLDCTDLIAEAGELIHLPSQRVQGENHGVGCTFSAALTSFLALGFTLKDAALKAKDFAKSALRDSFRLGGGAGPVNQTAGLREEAARYHVISDLQESIDILRSSEGILDLILDRQSSPAMAIPGALSLADVAEVDGGLKRVEAGLCQSGCIKFGCSRETGTIVLAAMKIEPQVRAAINLDPKARSYLKDMSLSIVDRPQFDLLAKKASGIRNCSESSRYNRNTRYNERSRYSKRSRCSEDIEGEDIRLPDAVWEDGSQERGPQVYLLGASATALAYLASMLARARADER